MGNSNLYATGTDTKNLINDNWSLTSQPEVSFQWEEKSVGFMDDRRDFILVTPTHEEPNYFSLYGQDFLHHIYVKIDVYTYQNLEHHENIVNELVSIIKANIRRENYVDLILQQSDHDNDTLRNMFRHSFIIRYRKLNP
tara:strand:+ start:763 stop:1179 length:417 start_codon:yes stop_codon:yes gene_type:complete